MKKIESLKSTKFAVSEDEIQKVNGGSAPTSTYREYDTHAPDCSVSCDRQLVDICFPYPF